MIKDNRNLIATDLICQDCCNVERIYRRSGRQKKVFHIKDLYCPYCGAVSKHVEVFDWKIAKISLESRAELSESEEYVLELLCGCEQKKLEMSQLKCKLKK